MMGVSALINLVEWKFVGIGERLCRLSLGRQDGRTPHLGVVLAAWDPSAAAESVDLVLRRLQSLSAVKWSMVVVANNNEVATALARPDGEYRLLAGSNREAEFSAYEEGRQFILSGSELRPDVWLIVNDRLPYYKADCLWGVTPALLHFASSVPMASGKIDFLPRHFELQGKKFRCYVRSNYMLVSAAAIDSIGTLCAVSADEYASEVSRAFSGGWPLSAWIGTELGEFLRSFLTEPGGENWMRAEPVSDQSWPRLRLKALSIINEWLLSLKLIDAKVPLVPWRLARDMSRLDPSGKLSQRLLWHYKADPGFGGALEPSLQGRLNLTAAVLAGRAGANDLGDRLLSSAARASVRARAAHEG
jgi:hypothetical protein